MQYATALSLTPSQRDILDKVVDTGQRMGMSPDLINIVANQAFYESSLGLLRKNGQNSNVKGLFQYDQPTWDRHSRPNALDIDSDDDQVGLMYRDVMHDKARYQQGVATGAIPSSLNFEDYVEVHHHLGDSALTKGEGVPPKFRPRINAFGLRILSLPKS